MKALVTGATGFIGSNLVRLLVRQGFQVKALVRKGATIGNLDGLPLEVALGDIRERAAVSKALKGCDYLFHCAACYTFWLPRVDEIYQINVQGTENVLSCALEQGIKRVVYTSSAATIGLPSNGDWGREEDEPRPQDVIGHYKKSKYQAEMVARRLGEQGLPLVMVNPTTPIGPGDVKPTPTGRLVLDFLRGRMPAYVHTGLNIIDVEDVAWGHLLALERGKPGERYILGHQNLYLHDFLALIEKVSHVKGPWLRLPLWLPLGAAYVNEFLWGRLLHRPPFISVEAVRMARKTMFFDPSKAVRELGLPQTPVEEAIEKAVQWFREKAYV